MFVSQICINRRRAKSGHARNSLAIVVISLTLGILSSPVAGDQPTEDSLGIRWIKVEAGTLTFRSGSKPSQVTIGSFMMSATEVTFHQYDAFCDATGKQKPDDNGWGRGSRPVFYVSYDDAVEFCQWLSKKTGSAVRLPTECEWEYAAQGGCHSKGYTYSGGNNPDEVSWNLNNSGNQTHPVGTKKPNELGLYDMTGSLWEWCADCPEKNPGQSQTEPKQSGTGGKRIVRGDSFNNPGAGMDYRMYVRLYRNSRHINIGFRIAKSE